MRQGHVLDDSSIRLVRVDVVEAWARHAYALQSLPGYTTSVRRAVLCHCVDGRAAYVEFWRVGWRLWRTTEWIGQIKELGAPRPVPRGFEFARLSRMYSVADRSMVLNIGRVDRIITFTGEDPPEGVHLLRQTAWAATLLIPNVGTVADWTKTAAHRLRPGERKSKASAAARYWRELLSKG